MNIAVAQSGGPTCAINASLVGVFRESLKEPAIDAIFGSVNGVEGIIQDHLIDLKTMIRTNEDMELLRQVDEAVQDADAGYRPRLVLTDFKQGFTEEDAGRMRRLLDAFRAGQFDAETATPA